MEWSVTETTIKDEYKIVLSATYAVNVPTAVIALEPASVSLPFMSACSADATLLLPIWPSRP